MPTDRIPLLFIHGAWLSSESWDTYAGFFSGRGYDVVAPEWPRKQMGAAAQRGQGEDIAGLGVDEIVGHFAAIVEDMDEDAFPDRPWGRGNNPKTAVHEFLRRNDRFVIDRDVESRLLFTVAPDGFLRCVKD